MLPRVNTLYCIASGVHLRRLGEEMVVYLAQCFETHLVDDAGAQVLETVQQMQEAALPCSIPSLHAWLSADAASDACMQAELESDVEAVLMPLLSELVRVGVLTTRAC